MKLNGKHANTEPVSELLAHTMPQAHPSFEQDLKAQLLQLYHAEITVSQPEEPQPMLKLQPVQLLPMVSSQPLGIFPLAAAMVALVAAGVIFLTVYPGASQPNPASVGIAQVATATPLPPTPTVIPTLPLLVITKTSDLKPTMVATVPARYDLITIPQARFVVYGNTLLEVGDPVDILVSMVDSDAGDAETRLFTTFVATTGAVVAFKTDRRFGDGEPQTEIMFRIERSDAEALTTYVQLPPDSTWITVLPSHESADTLPESNDTDRFFGLDQDLALITIPLTIMVSADGLEAGHIVSIWIHTQDAGASFINHALVLEVNRVPQTASVPGYVLVYVTPEEAKVIESSLNSSMSSLWLRREPSPNWSFVTIP
ncbi:MAG: hypothetical protein H7Y11_08095, partial [Armatimonadetes bacterium]|nr:hypothetical protein [Anaerolineae bacterium]